MNSRKSAPEKMMNTTSTDYMLPVTDNFGNEMVSLNINLKIMIENLRFHLRCFKTVKKPESFVFNFAKGSTPVINIQKH